jgi:uncharacterized membrane protein
MPEHDLDDNALPVRLARRRLAHYANCGIAAAIVAVAMRPIWEIVFAAATASDLRLHFDAALFARQGLALKIHVVGAVTALLIGGFILVRPKGGGLHRTLGWIWVVAMATTAASSFFLRGLNHDAFSFIHLLSGWVLVALPMALAATRKRNVTQHKRTMLGLYLGGLVFAGLLTFIPGRLMWQMFLG